MYVHIIGGNKKSKRAKHSHTRNAPEEITNLQDSNSQELIPPRKRLRRGTLRCAGLGHHGKKCNHCLWCVERCCACNHQQQAMVQIGSPSAFGCTAIQQQGSYLYSPPAVFTPIQPPQTRAPQYFPANQSFLYCSPNQLQQQQWEVVLRPKGMNQ